MRRLFLPVLVLPALMSPLAEAQQQGGPRKVIPYRQLPTFRGTLEDLDGNRMTVKIVEWIAEPVPDAQEKIERYKQSIIAANVEYNRARQLLMRRLVNLPPSAGVIMQGLRQNQLYLAAYAAALRAKLPPPPRLVTRKIVTTNLNFRFGDDLVVRKVSLGVEYDDKGFPVPITSEYRAKMKGTEGYPGYKGFNGDLVKGKRIQVYLAADEIAKPRKPRRSVIARLAARNLQRELKERGPRIVMAIVLSDQYRKEIDDLRDELRRTFEEADRVPSLPSAMLQKRILYFWMPLLDIIESVDSPEKVGPVIAGMQAVIAKSSPSPEAQSLKAGYVVPANLDVAIVDLLASSGDEGSLRLLRRIRSGILNERASQLAAVVLQRLEKVSGR